MVIEDCYREQIINHHFDLDSGFQPYIISNSNMFVQESPDISLLELRGETVNGKSASEIPFLPAGRVLLCIDGFL